MKIKFKLLVLIAVIFASVSVFVAFQLFTERQTRRFINDNEINEKRGALASILTLQERFIRSYVEDYSYWDDMVAFVAKPDKDWARLNLDPSVATFNLKQLMVFSPDFELLHCKAAEEGQEQCVSPLDKDQLKAAFLNSVFCHFYLSSKGRFLEVFGSTINGYDDPQRAHPAGYFLVTRAIDEKYILELAALVNSDILLEGYPRVFLRGSRDVLGFSHALWGKGAAPAAFLNVTWNSSELAAYSRSHEGNLKALLVFCLLFLAVMSWFILVQIMLPLQSIHKGLVREDANEVKHLLSSKSDLGDLARLIVDSLAQRKSLSLEIAERVKIEKGLIEQESVMRGQALELEDYIKELKKTQEMLIQSEKLASLGRLVSDMAHEINNPLMIISGNAQLSLDEQCSAEVKRSLQIIIEESARAKSIITRLLRFSKPSKAQLVETDICQHIEGIIGLVEHQFSLDNVLIRRDYGQDLPRPAIDGQQIHEVVINLLNNARDAMPKGGVITIGVRLDEGKLRVDVRDTGPGMTAEALKRFPEPFYTTKDKGTGLGLPVCYGIMKTHGGELRTNLTFAPAVVACL